MKIPEGTDRPQGAPPKRGSTPLRRDLDQLHTSLGALGMALARACRLDRLVDWLTKRLTR